MNYKLTPHKLDKDMLEVTLSFGKGLTYLAFIIHVDCVPSEVIEEVEAQGEAVVEWSLK